MRTKCAIYAKTYRDKNPVRHKQITDQWIVNNPDRIKELRRMADQRRRAAKLDNHWNRNVHSLVVLEMSDGVCGICYEDVDPTNYEIDHIIPLAQGGDHSYENTQAAHRACNTKKGPRMQW